MEEDIDQFTDEQRNILINNNQETKSEVAFKGTTDLSLDSQETNLRRDIDTYESSESLEKSVSEKQSETPGSSMVPDKIPDLQIQEDFPINISDDSEIEDLIFDLPDEEDNYTLEGEDADKFIEKMIETENQPITEKDKKLSEEIKKNIDKLTLTIEEEPKKEDKPIKTKDLIWEMRMLLNNYPVKINFIEKEDSISVINNILLCYDLLNYCNNKSVTKEIKDKIQLELSEFEKGLDLTLLRTLYRSYIESSLHFGKHHIKSKLDNLINRNSQFIYSKLQYYILAIPMKSKQQTHYKTGHGLPASFAEEYEQEQMDEGSRVQDGQAFKIEEGKVIPLE